MTAFNKPKNKPVIKKLSDGWYSFKGIDQTGNYIKINCLCCGTDVKAFRQAFRMLPEGTLLGDIVMINETELERVKRTGRY